MPHFRYTATTEEGTTTSGTIEAVSLQAAREALHDLGMEIEDIAEDSGHHSSLDADFPFHQSEAVAQSKAAESNGPTELIENGSDGSKGTEGETVESVEHSSPAYAPLTDTLRLYSGWLLAWYLLVYAVGYYAYTREFPISIPYASSLIFSPAVLYCTFSAFLYVWFCSIHEKCGGGVLKGFCLFGIGLTLFFVFQALI